MYNFKALVQGAQGDDVGNGDAIGFGLGYLCGDVTSPNKFDVVYNIDENHWNGKVGLQLKIKDIKV